MSDEVTETPKRKGRPPGKKAKRHDPSPDQVIGHVGKETLYNKEDGKRYAWLKEEGIDSDAADFKRRGYHRAERKPDGVKPAWDAASESDTHYRVGDLVLYEANDDHVKQWDDFALKQSNQRMEAIHQAAKATGGYMTRTAEMRR